MSKNARRYYLYKLLSFVAYAVPMAVLFGINHKEYLKNEYTGLGFFGYIMLLFLALSFKSKLTAVAQKNSILTMSTVIFVVALIMYKVGEQLLMISGMSLLGCLLSTIFERPADVYRRYGWKDGVVYKGVPVPHKKAWAWGYMGLPLHLEAKKDNESNRQSTHL
ncbi:MAG: hypothetical protein LBK70_00385 [Clostridiales bacterium]|jgi:hypothetical protein|nr:hypothetical protein [Clostridiales bacterium]